MKYSLVLSAALLFFSHTEATAQYGDAYHKANQQELNRQSAARQQAQSDQHFRNIAPAKPASTPASYSTPAANTTGTTTQPAQPAPKSLNERLVDDYNEKEARFQSAASGISFTKENYRRLFALAEEAGFDHYAASRRLASIGDASNSYSEEGRAIGDRIRLADKLQNEAKEETGLIKAQLLSASFRAYPTSWYGTDAARAWEAIGVFDSGVHYRLAGMALKEKPNGFDLSDLADAYGLDGNYAQAARYYSMSHQVSAGVRKLTGAAWGLLMSGDIEGARLAADEAIALHNQEASTDKGAPIGAGLLLLKAALQPGEGDADALARHAADLLKDKKPVQSLQYLDVALYLKPDDRAILQQHMAVADGLKSWRRVLADKKKLE